MRKITCFSLVLITILFASCKEEITLDSSKKDTILVVDGLITNEKGAIIKLFLTSEINNTVKLPYSGCLVSINENNTKSETLAETEPGIYCSTNDGIIGKVGNQYQLIITTPDGKIYKSDFQTIAEPVEIDSLYYDFMKREVLGYPFGLPGYQFYVTAKQTHTSETYFLWTMEESFQYTADYKLYAIDGGAGIRICGIDTVTEYENLYRCWITKPASYIFTGKTSNLSIPHIEEQPLMFIGTDSKKLQERYSLLLTQCVINKEAYYFWKGIEDQISEDNFLVANQPYNIIGNVENINNPEEMVFGYFTVASVTQKRIFVNRPYAAFYYEICYIDYDGNFLPPPKFYILLENGMLGEVLEPCVNCTSEGGEPVKPDFWVDF